MGKKRSSSNASHKRRPPPSTVDPATILPSPAVESLDPVIQHEADQVLFPFRRGDYKEALKLIRESISRYPQSAHLHCMEAIVHKYLADEIAKDFDEITEHLTDGVCSAKLAVELLPNSVYYTSILATLLTSLARFNREWDKVIEVCQRGLKIDNSTDPRVEKNLGKENMEKWSKESRIRHHKQEIVEFLKMAYDYQRSIKSPQKVGEVVNKEAEGKEDFCVEEDVKLLETTENQIGRLVACLPLSKQEFMSHCSKNKVKDKDKVDKTLKYKHFWSSLSSEKKRDFLKVSIEDLKKHFMSLKHYREMEFLLEAIGLAKEHGTWKFWKCCLCDIMFSDVDLYRDHMRELHQSKFVLLSDAKFESELIEMIENCAWKPVDTDLVIKLIGSQSGDNVPSKASINDQKWPLSDDIKRAKILEKIRGILLLLIKSNFQARQSYVRWLIQYAMFELTTKIKRLSNWYRNNGLLTLDVICFLGASKLKEILKFLKHLARICRIRENPEMGSSMYDKFLKDQPSDMKERVVFSKDFSYLFLDERLFRGGLNVTNYIDAVADGGFAVTSDVNLYEDDMLPDSDDITSWLYDGPTVRRVASLWTTRNEITKTIFCLITEEFEHLERLSCRASELRRKIGSLHALESICIEEMKKRDKNAEYVPKDFYDLFKQRQNDLQCSDFESEIISNILIETTAATLLALSGDQLRNQGGMKDVDIFTELALQRLGLQLLKELAFMEAVIFRGIGASQQYELEVERMSFYDYRCVILSLLKSFLQKYLQDLFHKDAVERSDAAAEALLAELALDAGKNINNGCHKTQDEKKNKIKKKRKNFRKAKESKATDAGKNFQLYQNDDDFNSELGVSENVDEFERQIDIEERMLEKNLEYQRQIENEAKKNCIEDKNRKMSGSIGENASETLSVSEGCSNGRLTQDKKKIKKMNKNKSFRKTKEYKETDGCEQFQLCQEDASPDIELGQSARVDQMKKLITEEGILDENLEHENQIEDEAKQKCLAETNEATGETIGESEVEGVSVIYLQHVDDAEYERRFKADIEKAVCLSLGSLQKHYGLVLSIDIKDEPTSQLDVHLYVIIQSQWLLRLFRDEFMSRSEIRHTHAGDPCFVCAYSDTYTAIRIAARDMPRVVVVPFSSKTLRPIYDFFQEWTNLENPVDEEIGVSPGAYELKQHFVAVIRKIVEELEHERQITN